MKPGIEAGPKLEFSRWSSWWKANPVATAELFLCYLFQWDKKPFTCLTDEILQRKEMIWPRLTHLVSKAEYPPSSVATFMACQSQECGSYPIIFLYISHQAVLVLGWSHFRIRASIDWGGSPREPGWAHLYNASSWGRVSWDLGRCKKCILSARVWSRRSTDSSQVNSTPPLPCSIF